MAGRAAATPRRGLVARGAASPQHRAGGGGGGTSRGADGETSRREGRRRLRQEPGRDPRRCRVRAAASAVRPPQARHHRWRGEATLPVSEGLCEEAPGCRMSVRYGWHRFVLMRRPLAECVVECASCASQSRHASFHQQASATSWLPVLCACVRARARVFQWTDQTPSEAVEGALQVRHHRFTYRRSSCDVRPAPGGYTHDVPDRPSSKSGSSMKELKGLTCSRMGCGGVQGRKIKVPFCDALASQRLGSARLAELRKRLCYW